MDSQRWTDTPPTEAGTYLFYGLRKSRLTDVLGTSTSPGFEVLRVREDGLALGHDIYARGELIGFWAPVRDEVGMEQRLRKLALTQLLVRVRKSIPDHDWYRGGFTAHRVSDALGFCRTGAVDDEVLAEWVALGWAKPRTTDSCVYDFTPEAPMEASEGV